MTDDPRVELARLSRIIKRAPHDWFKCSISGHILPKGKRCNCWRGRALTAVRATAEVIQKGDGNGKY